jgi:hypothetical protein
MKRIYVAGAVIIGFSWLSMMLWSVGYSAGYEDGSSTAWVQARNNLRPNNIPMQQLATFPTNDQESF